jgi:choline dehydrogenase-like flavoprotein
VNVTSNNSYYDSSEKTGDSENNFMVNENNRLMWKSAEKLGYKPEKIPRNVKKCVDCGHCCFGCSHKSKQSTATAVLEPILLTQVKNSEEQETEASSTASGNSEKKKVGRLYVLPDCKVTRILKKGEGYNQVAVGLDAVASIYEKGLGKKIARNLIRKR